MFNIRRQCWQVNDLRSTGTQSGPFEERHHARASTERSAWSDFIGYPVDKSLTNLAITHDSIIASRSFQINYANRHRIAEPPLKKDNLAYLATKSLNLPKGRVHKLLPIYIGPYAIMSSNVSTLNHTLDLPEELVARNIHPNFHISVLKPHISNDNKRFPERDVRVYYDFGQGADVEWEVDEILAHQSDGHSLRFLAKWNLGDTTWEPLRASNELRAPNECLALRGVTLPSQLPKHSDHHDEFSSGMIGSVVVIA